MRVLILRNIEIEGPGLLEGDLARAGIDSHILDTWRDIDELDTAANFDGVIVLGGPMNVADEGDWPFLAPVKRQLRDALQRRIPCAGICLGAQLLADALGAPLHPLPRPEIGWHELTAGQHPDAVQFLEGAPDHLVAFHWHGQAFALPEGAVSLCSSDATEHQGFLHSKAALGLQFHFEVTRPMAQSWCAAYRGDLRRACLAPETLLKGFETHAQAYQRTGSFFRERLIAFLQGGADDIDRTMSPFESRASHDFPNRPAPG